MIAHIRGLLVNKNPTTIVIEAGGVGFFVRIPLSSYRALGEVGEQIKVLCYLHSREDSLQLYGFATEQEKELFQLLISVSGIGPRTAQGILSGISVVDFQKALLNHDLVSLTSAPGVGRKTAERLILELKDKVGEVQIDKETIPVFGSSSSGEESVLALVSLGYNRSKAQQLVQRVIQETDAKTVEDIIVQALKRS
jgi:Holliday junction DNA helicase RuvA